MEMVNLGQLYIWAFIISLIGSLKSTAFRKNPLPNSKALLGNSNQRHPAGENLNILNQNIG